MAKYVNAVDLTDPSFDITEAHCAAGDDFVDSVLWELEINPDDVALPAHSLTRISGYWAKREAAIEGAISERSPLSRKAYAFEKNAKWLASKVSRKSLGIVTGRSFGSITLGRG